MHPLQKEYAREVREIAAAAVRAAALGYVASHGGNLSVRARNDLVLITPTKVAKRDITPEDICFITMDGETLYAAPGRRPTSEWPFHTRVFRRRPDLRAVIHAHPPLLTGFAIAGSDLLCRPYLPEPVIEVGPMLLVPYALPGSETLAEAFDGPLERSNGFLMENHGALMTSGEGILRALDLLEMMEGAAQSILTARALGNLHQLPDDAVDALEGAMHARGLPMPGAEGKNATLREAFQ